MTRIRTTTFLLMIVALLTALVAAPTAAGGPRKLALGVTRQSDRSITEYQSYVTEVGRAPAIWGISATWGATSRDFPSLDFLAQLDPTTVPMIWWQPLDPSNWHDPAYRNLAIIKGTHDAYIHQFAKDAKAYGKTVLLRFAQEMEGRWFPWGIEWFDNSPARFKAAWRHIWKIFRAEGATNVKFVWSPYSPTKKVYPGNKYVDYAGFSAFNWADKKHPWASLQKVAAKQMKLMKRVTKKPVLIAEMGAAPQRKAAWIRKGLPAIYKKWPQIKGIVYFDVNASLFGKAHRDWRLENPSNAMKTYKKLLKKKAFQGRIS